MESETIIKTFLSGIPEWNKEAEGACELQGLYIEADDHGRAVQVERVKVAVK
jgi:calcineurin-like phosphoesterase